jgi:hypothetical protein
MLQASRAQSFVFIFKVLEREFRDRGGKVVVKSFKPGIVDTLMQNEAMPIVGAFRAMKQKQFRNGNSRQK